MIVKTSPGSIWKLTPSTARRPPKSMTRPSAAKRVLAGAPSACTPSAAERCAVVEREGREVELDLAPAAVDAEGLEEDEQHEDQPEEPGLETRLLDELIDREERGRARVLAEHRGKTAPPRRDRVASLGDRDGQQRHEDGAEERAVQAAEAADDDHQQ